MHGQQNNEIGSLVVIKLKFKLFYLMNICAIFFSYFFNVVLIGSVIENFTICNEGFLS